jgi:hypothetical protein
MKKRILVLLSVVALMVVMLAMSVAPAFAAWNPDTGCRGDDVLFRQFFHPVDGRYTVDDHICVAQDKDGGTKKVYDNRF